MLYNLKCYSIINTYNKSKPSALRALINKDSLIPLIFLLPGLWGLRGILLAPAAADALTFLFAVILTFLVVRRYRRMAGQKQKKP